MPKANYKCMTKATNREKGEPRYSQNWIISKRGFINFYDDHFELGSWKFEFDKIKNPILHKSRQMLIPVKILTFDYQDKHYQFGLNPWADPLPHVPFSPKIEKTPLKMSASSLIIRLAILAYFVYIIIQKCK